ncbi:universal stress protein UspA [Microvirga vignae]|uniref:Universal stress protein n=1 Tax=Microvirga vignae TaxID=1225564 RepID=A0A0H1RBQ4_9HYPH|nr:universal stress protein [Microvirga vignae]KLK90027.1 universal stress protein UspA [Microvirga vignae]
MYNHVLIATDGSELATRGLVHGLALAKGLGATVTVVTVTEMWSAWDMAHEARMSEHNPVDEYEQRAKAAARRILDTAVNLAQEQQGLDVQTLHVADQHPAEGIITACQSQGCDLIVMSSHGRRGLGRVLLGSQAAEVLAHSTVPVLVVR